KFGSLVPVGAGADKFGSLVPVGAGADKFGVVLFGLLFPVVVGYVDYPDCLPYDISDRQVKNEY
ncbi:4217_t:CDS:2, partial [Racocetra fulgida]